MIDRLIDMDVSSWAEYRDEVWDLARSFRAGGGRTAFLSNGVPETMTRLRAERPLDRWFDVVVVSYEVGLAKPDPRIFELCLSRLGAHPREALFVDDRAENVAAAERLGIRTFHFTGDDASARLMDAVRSRIAYAPYVEPAVEGANEGDGRRNPARARRRVQLRGGARRQPARRTVRTLSRLSRAPTKQMGPYPRSSEP